jgi:hypothetical protein
MLCLLTQHKTFTFLRHPEMYIAKFCFSSLVSVTESQNRLSFLEKSWKSTFIIVRTGFVFTSTAVAIFFFSLHDDDYYEQSDVQMRYC